MELLALIKPLLGALNVDPGDLANRLGKDQLAVRMARGKDAVAQDLEGHGLTPAQVAGDAKLSRQMVRSALFQLFKKALGSFRGSGHVADALRDHYDDKIVARVVPQLTAAMTTEETVRLVVKETVEQIF